MFEFTWDLCFKCQTGLCQFIWKMMTSAFETGCVCVCYHVYFRLSLVCCLQGRESDWFPNSVWYWCGAVWWHLQYFFYLLWCIWWGVCAFFGICWQISFISFGHKSNCVELQTFLSQNAESCFDVLWCLTVVRSKCVGIDVSYCSEQSVG